MTFGEQSTEKESHDMLSYSFDQGINILDTAEIVSTVLFIQPLSYLLMLILILSALNHNLAFFCHLVPNSTQERDSRED
jgi:hypothetical protein